MKDIIVLLKNANNDYQVRLDKIGLTTKSDAWLKEHKDRISNIGYFEDLCGVVFKPKYCFYCEKEVFHKKTHVYCPECGKETGLWDSIASIKNQKKCIKRVNEEYERVSMVCFSKIIVKRKGDLFNY